VASLLGNYVSFKELEEFKREVFRKKPYFLEKE